MTNSFFDFNNADDVDIDERQSETLSPDEIKGRVLDRLESALAYLLPEGKIRHGKYIVGNIDGDQGKSLVIELRGHKAGVWNDFATNDGGDIFDLWAYKKGLNIRQHFPQVIDSISQWLGTPAAIHTPSKNKKKSPPVDELGPHSAKWDYKDKDGNLIACVYRYDLPDGKEFRPWDVKARKQQTPAIRPLYNQPNIAQSTHVILVEGEKCVDALMSKNHCATTAMNGANAPVDKTDWSPLKDKHVIIWPDNDEAGKAYADKAAEAIANVAAASVRIMNIPKDKPAKWDCADAIRENENISKYIHDAVASVNAVSETQNNLIRLEDWLACKKFVGKPKSRRWLVDGIFPLAQVSLLAASGGVGKSYLLAQLACEVAKYDGNWVTAPMLFGGALASKGAAVYITAEDDETEIHTRLFQLGDIPDKLYAIPLPDTGGAKPLFTPDPVKRSPIVTPFWESLVNQLKDIRDLRLVILDPLQPLCALDLNIPENAQFVCSQLSALASGLQASVIVSHHFAKREAMSPEQARDAIRGSGGLVDGVRASYALWQVPNDKAQSICKALNTPFKRGGVVMGGIVKANGKANLHVTTFVRDERKGILVDRSLDLQCDKTSEGSLLSLFVKSISDAARDGRPYTKTGINGVHNRRFELPEVFHDFGRKKLTGWVEILQSEGKLVAAMAPGQTTVKWLDEPNGPVARGEAEFVAGHMDRSTGGRK